MKKILLGLGTFAAVAAPIAGVVSCGTASPNKLKELFDDAGSDEGKKEKALKKFYDATEPVSSLFGSEEDFSKKGIANFENVKDIAGKIAALSTTDNEIEFLDIAAITFSDVEVSSKKYSAKIMFIGPANKDAATKVETTASDVGNGTDFGLLSIQGNTDLSDALWATSKEGAGQVAQLLSSKAKEISHMLIASKIAPTNSGATTFALTLVQVKETAYLATATDSKTTAAIVGEKTITISSS